MPIRIHFLGGADEVGASCLLVETGGVRLLIDAGIRVSPRARDGLSGELLPDLSPLSEAPPDAVLVTHAHADHIGALPLLLGSHPDVPAYATASTIALSRVMLQDALRIMDTRLEAEGELPAYDRLQLERLESAFRPLSAGEPLFVRDAVRVRAFRAGHIPGAVSLLMESAEGSVLVSGDLSFSPMRATPTAVHPRARPDVLVLESTYGGKLHASRRAEESRLIESVSRIAEGGGRVLIPAFALGRAQEVALVLDAALATDRMPRVPVYLDGMTRSISRVFAEHPDALTRDLARHVEKTGSLWRSGGIRYVEGRREREELMRARAPAVIISSSGMLTGGASPLYAQHIAGEPESAIFITGYQDEEAPGRRLQRLAETGEGTLRLGDRTYPVACEIGTYSLSAHADESELTQFAAHLEPQRTYLVHGDGGARERMSQLLRERKLNVALPSLAEVVEPGATPRSHARALVARGIGAGRPPLATSVWEALVERELGGAVLRLDDLARFWYGDDPPLAGCEALERELAESPLRFTRDWRDSTCFRVHSPAHVEQMKPRIDWLEAVGSVEGRLLLMQTASGGPYLALGTDTDGPHVHVSIGTGKDVRCLAERLVIAGELWTPPARETDEIAPGPDDQAELRKQLRLAEARLAAGARDAIDISQVARLIDGTARSLAGICARLGLELDASSSDSQLALAWRLLEFRARAAFGQFAFHLPDRGKSAKPGDDPLDFNRARTLVKQLLPTDAGVRKLSCSTKERTITVRFDFPDVIGRRYGDLLARASVITGWTLRVHPSANHQALILETRRLLGNAGAVAVHLAERCVEVTLNAVPDDWEALVTAFRSTTGFDLTRKGERDMSTVTSRGPRSLEAAASHGPGETRAPAPGPGSPRVSAPDERVPQMEINAAYEALERRLGPLGLQRAGLKGESICLTFITPEVGRRHQAVIDDAANEVGYALYIHPHPNQHDLMEVVDRLCREHRVVLAKTPSLHVDERVIRIKPVDRLDPQAVAALRREVERACGWELRVRGGRRGR